MKSKVAAEAVRKMNPNINICSYVDPVGSDTEHLYSDSFFEQLHGVTNALDNLKARKCNKQLVLKSIDCLKDNILISAVSSIKNH